MPAVDIERYINRVGLCRAQDLVDEGIHYRPLQRALEAGIVVRPTFRRGGPVPGLYASAEVAADPDLGVLVACMLTDGVVFGRTAGVRHQLTNDTPGPITVLVPNAFVRVSPQVNIAFTRTRNPDLLTVGVETCDTEYGLQYKMTSRARTVVDLLCLAPVGWDSRHAKDAVENFLENGGEPAEITDLARSLGRDPEDRIQAMVDNIHAGMSAPRLTR